MKLTRASIARRPLSSLSGFPAVAALPLLLATGPAAAVVVGAESGGFAIDVDLTHSTTVTLTGLTVSSVAGDAALSLGPLAALSSAAPPPYTGAAAMATLDADSGAGSDALIRIDAAAGGGANALEVNNTSNVDGGLGPRGAAATASVLGLAIVAEALAGALPIDPIRFMSLDAGAIQSSASVAGDVGTLAANGDAFLAGASLTLLGFSTIDLSGSATPAPNTIINTLVPGLSVVVNEQIVDGDRLTVNALRLSFDDVDLSATLNLAAGLVDAGAILNGEIVVSQSGASLTAAVAAPPAFALLAAGLCLLGGRRGRGRTSLTG